VAFVLLLKQYDNGLISDILIIPSVMFENFDVKAFRFRADIFDFWSVDL